MAKSSILFLLGSGASPAPKVNELNQHVFDREKDLHTNGVWVPVDSKAECGEPGIASVVRRLLRRLREIIALWQDRPIDKVSYEAVAAACVELWKENGTSRNALIGPMYSQLENEFGPDAAMCPSNFRLHSPAEAFGGLLDEAKNWILWTVVHALRDVPDNKLELIRDVYGQLLPMIDGWNVATLNHDLCLERVFANLNVKYSDGFESEGSVRSFCPRLLGEKHLLLKLHGGIDWRWQPDRQRYVRVIDSRCGEARAGRDPAFLVGTYTKLEEYSYAVYPKIMATFDRVLERAERIVVCGYGFGDAGVNMRLISNLQFSTETLLTIIHPDPESLIGDAPGHAANFLRNLPAEVFLQRSFEELATDEGLACLRAHLG